MNLGFSVFERFTLCATLKNAWYVWYQLILPSFRVFFIYCDAFSASFHRIRRTISTSTVTLNLRLSTGSLFHRCNCEAFNLMAAPSWSKVLCIGFNSSLRYSKEVYQSAPRVLILSLDLFSNVTLSIILYQFHEGFSMPLHHTWSSTLDFIVSRRTRPFQCYLSIT